MVAPYPSLTIPILHQPVDRPFDLSGPRQPARDGEIALNATGQEQNSSVRAHVTVNRDCVEAVFQTLIDDLPKQRLLNGPLIEAAGTETTGGASAARPMSCYAAGGVVRTESALTGKG